MARLVSRSLRLGALAATCLLVAHETTAQEPNQGPAPVTVVSGAAGRNYLNLSVDALLAVGASTEPDTEGIEIGGHDPAQRGFTLQNLEIVFDGAVDPYFRAQANLILHISPDGETQAEIEEAFATTSSLPHGLQVKAGQFLTEFGRSNPTHPHVWDFADQPLAAARFLGPEGLRSVGVRGSWLMPTPFYSEIFLAVQNANGETAASFGGAEGETVFGRALVPNAAKSGSDLLYAPRWAASVDIGDTQTVLFGVSGAFGPNGTGPDAKTRIGGADFFWKWKSPRAQKGFPFVKVQVEAMRRHYEAAAHDALPETTFEDRGEYAQIVWGPRPMWTVGLRYDRVDGDVGDDPFDPFFLPRTRTSVMGSWYPTEYSKLRVQYAFDDRTGLRDAHTVWLQFEFLLGAHAAHKF